MQITRFPPLLLLQNPLTTAALQWLTRVSHCSVSEQAEIQAEDQKQERVIRKLVEKTIL